MIQKVVLASEQDVKKRGNKMMKHSANVMSGFVLSVVLVVAITASGATADSLFEPLENASPNSLIVGLTLNAMDDFRQGQYHELDELNAFYGVVHIEDLRIIPAFVLKFDRDYNTLMLAHIYAEANPEGLRYIHPDYILQIDPIINHIFLVPFPDSSFPFNDAPITIPEPATLGLLLVGGLALLKRRSK